VKEKSGLGPNGVVERTFQVIVDSRTLLEDYEWHSLVRPDLEEIDGEFSIEAVMDGLMLSCRRAYCKILLVQESAIVAAMEEIRGFAERADPPSGFAAVFIGTAQATGVMPVTVSPISTELADVAETALQQARVIAA
jgi:hypothetical protein